MFPITSENKGKYVEKKWKTDRVAKNLIITYSIFVWVAFFLLSIILKFICEIISCSGSSVVKNFF